MSDILDLIDNALAGSTSADAMRWCPDEPDKVLVCNEAYVTIATADLPSWAVELLLNFGMMSPDEARARLTECRLA